MATDRSSRVSRAFHTSPIPPAPSGERTSYGPRREPALIAMKCVGILLAAVDPPHPGRVRSAQRLSDLAGDGRCRRGNRDYGGTFNEGHGYLARLKTASR